MTNAPPPPAWSDRQPVAISEIGRPGGFWIRFVAYLLDAFKLDAAAWTALNQETASDGAWSIESK